MKKLFLLFAAALMSVSMFAFDGAVPTDADLDYAAGQLCVAVYFQGEVCNDIVWVGTYKMNEAGTGWSENPAELAKFEPVDGFDGWYQVAVDDESKSIEGKPVQLKKDGSFSWDYQTGDADSWELIRGTVTIEPGFSGEANLKGYDKSTPVVMVSGGWKAGNTPCGAPVEYKYTEYENWQIKYGNSWEWSDNMEKVEDGLFKLEVYWEGTGFNVKSDENPIKEDWFAPEELVLGEEVIAPVTVDVYLKVIDDETVMIGVGVEPSVPASGPTVDETGITVNGRKYGFPVRLVTEFN